MPFLATLGAGSIGAYRNFKRGGLPPPYNYVAQVFGPNTTGTAYGGSTVNSLVELNPAVPSATARLSGIVADRNFIVVSGIYYSLDNGLSWNLSGADFGQFTDTSMPPGLNGSVAYNPTARRFFGHYTISDGGMLHLVYSINSSGVTTYAGVAGSASNAQVYNMIYSPALDRAFLWGFGSSLSNVLSIDGTTGSTGSVRSASSPGNYRAGISHDGYPLGAKYNGFGTSFNLYKYTTESLTSWTDLGGISDSYGSFPYNCQSPIHWFPINGRYYSIGAQQVGNVFVLRRSTNSGDPGYFNYAAQVTISGASSITKINLMEDENGVIWIFGSADNGNFMYYSNNGGTVITQASPVYSSISRNFNPIP